MCMVYQVFDLGETAPGEVLQQLYENLEILKQDGDPLASEIQKRLKLIVSHLFSFQAQCTKMFCVPCAEASCTFSFCMHARR